MTNITASILMFVGTNWITVGTFTPVDGSPQQHIQQGYFVTNHTLVTEYQSQMYSITLKQMEGPVAGSRMQPIEPAQGQATMVIPIPGAGAPAPRRFVIPPIQFHTNQLAPPLPR